MYMFSYLKNKVIATPIIIEWIEPRPLSLHFAAEGGAAGESRRMAREA